LRGGSTVRLQNKELKDAALPAGLIMPTKHLHHRLAIAMAQLLQRSIGPFLQAAGVGVNRLQHRRGCSK
jgi:hypothetical protein